MSTKTIKAWVNGAVQDVSVPDVEYVAPSGGMSGASALITTITLPSANWEGASSPYYQTISSDYFSTNSMVDLQPTPEQLAAWQDDGFAFATQNDNGTVKVYVAGGLPTTDITVQVKIQEVIVV
jgi:hypothetical protein